MGVSRSASAVDPGSMASSVRFLGQGASDEKLMSIIIGSSEFQFGPIYRLSVKVPFRRTSDDDAPRGSRPPPPTPRRGGLVRARDDAPPSPWHWLLPIPEGAGTMSSRHSSLPGRDAGRDQSTAGGQPVGCRCHRSSEPFRSHKGFDEHLIRRPQEHPIFSSPVGGVGRPNRPGARGPGRLD